ncbi:uncharacterized protein LOC132612164 [Lycium barbarum]|uniref:uncharacterized protein LOC132612164 n=1 Tax=Lycium barbarum TaxID=112863 RepID=UPI00293E19FB|nr:uncharacterized protein LOC132612164 [Lycium barbarum]
MRNTAHIINAPWAVCGDFNSILSTEEKMGGIPHGLNKSIPFMECLQDCGLNDIGFSGSRFTWCNERKEENVIWKRLDRMVVNDNWNDVFPISNVIHMPRISSDQCPLLINCDTNQNEMIRYFRFLNFWTDLDDFLDIVKENWCTQTDGNIFWEVQQKMKNTSKALSIWSRNTISDIFVHLKHLEEKVIQEEENYQSMAPENNRIRLHKTKVDIILYHKQVDSFWRQKADLKWQVEGDENTSFFHLVVRGKRSILNMHRILHNGDWIQGDNEIGLAVVDFYQNLFSQGIDTIDRNILDHIPNLITESDNDYLNAIPIIQEVKEVVFDINSSPGPDGFSGLLFQKSWQIVGDDRFNMEFAEFRPICLSNVTQKIVSKVLNNKLSKIISKLISPNQSGFVKGRAIGENVMLAQEIIHDMKKNNKGGNVIFKIDMTKAYDRMSWNFICSVMRKMGFNEAWVHAIWNLLSNMWYSVVQKKEFSIKYLGCPLFQGRKKIEYFTDDPTKILKKLGTWHCKMLSSGGKFILIKHVLSAMPDHLLSICQPPKGILKIMEKIFANFFWGRNEGKTKHYWVSWHKMCKTTAEGGIGIRSLYEINENFGAKLWWQFRTKDSFWADFLKAKYARRVHPSATKWSYTQSHCWKRMMKIRDKIDHLIQWNANKGNSNF